MMGKNIFKSCKISVVTLINAQSFKADDLPEEIEYIDISAVGTGVLNEALSILKKEQAPGRARRMVAPGDTIVSTVRPNRRSFLFLGMPNPNTVASTGFAVLTPSSKVVPRYLYYWISRPEFSEYLAAHAKGSAYPAVSPDDIASAEIQLPEIPVQHRIAGILSAYDDLIENNLRRIKILEEMAQAIYREWFVHFHFPGHEKVKMVDSPLGKIPERWELEEVKNILRRLKSGTVYTEADVAESGPVPVIDQSRNSFLGFHNSEPDHVASPENPIIIFGDHTCKMQLMVEPFSVGPNVVPFISDNSIPILFLYFVIRNLVETKEYKRHWTELTSKQVVLALNEYAKMFSDSITPMFEQIDSLTRKNLILRRTRDLLLPKLISGEVDVAKLDDHTE